MPVLVEAFSLFCPGRNVIDLSQARLVNMQGTVMLVSAAWQG